MKCDALFKRIDELEKEYVGFWQDICNIESPTEYKAGVDAVGEYFINAAKKRDWQTEVHKESVSGNAVCITMNPDAKGAPAVLSGHMDTVHPVGFFGSPAVKVAWDENKIYGPGVVDCKGGIAASFLAMAALEDIGFKDRPVRLLLQSDEEFSSRTSAKGTINYICEKSRGCVAFLNMEGHGKGKATLTRKGICRYMFEITGKAAHACKCYEGASAILEAAHKIIRLEAMKDPDGLTCNCGKITGGTAENTVAELCTFTADIRFATSEQMEKADALCKQVAEKSFLCDGDGNPQTTCKLTLKSRRVSMEKEQRNFDLLDKMNEIYRQNGLPELVPTHGNGGSDAADASAYGLPAVDSLGTHGGGIHSKNEWAAISSLAESAKRAASVIYCI